MNIELVERGGQFAVRARIWFFSWYLQLFGYDRGCGWFWPDYGCWGDRSSAEQLAFDVKTEWNENEKFKKSKIRIIEKL